MRNFFSRFIHYVYLGTLPFIYSCSSSAGEHVQPGSLTDSVQPAKPEYLKKVVVGYNSVEVMRFIDNSAMHTEGWDTLPQALFWKRIIQLSPDSSIVNIAASRQPVDMVYTRNWASQTESEKSLSKAWICRMNSLDSGTCLYVSIGRRDFFEHRKTLSTIDKAIQVFQKNDVDPWYAQTILLIESPGKSTQHSWAGASGPFQLMPEVGRRFGLRVTRSVDERQNLEKSAYAASQLLGKMFIPKVRDMLDARSIKYNENDLWFRLLVMHTYHAGPGNVSAVLNVINPSEGNVDLIRKMWATEARGFKNESQNYSQIALACILNFNDIIGNGDTVNLVYGDAAYKKINTANFSNSDSELVAYTQCMLEYENDFIDGVIPFDYFMSRVNTLKNDMAATKASKTGDINPIAIAYPVDESHYINMSNMLIRKRKTEDAIALLKYNISMFPSSPSAIESLENAIKVNSLKPMQVITAKRVKHTPLHSKNKKRH